MNLIIKSQYDSLIPPLSLQEYDSLRTSIGENGQWIPIIINDKNEILDGHHRYKICKELNIKPSTITRNFSSQTEEIIFVGECNLKRRQLNSIQRIKIVKELEPHYTKLAKLRMKAGKKIDDPVQVLAQGKTRDILADKAQVSHTTYEQGSHLLENASNQRLEELDDGRITINKAYHEIAKSTTEPRRMNLKHPYSFSLTQSIIEDIQYYKQTVPDQYIDKKVEDFIQTIVPKRGGNDTSNF